MGEGTEGTEGTEGIEKRRMRIVDSCGVPA